MEIEIKLRDLKVRFPTLKNKFIEEFAEKFHTVKNWQGRPAAWEFLQQH